MIDSTINRSVRRQIARSFVASCDRSHDQSWCATTDRTINRRVRRRITWPIVTSATDRTIGHSTNRNVVRQFTSSRSTERDVVRRVSPPIVRWHDQLRDRSYHCVIRDHAQLVVRPQTTGGTITQDLSATAYFEHDHRPTFEHDHRPCCDYIFLAITHDLCDQSYVRFTICPGFQHFSVAAWP